MTTRSSLSLLAAGTALLLGLASCGGGGSGTPAQPKPNPNPNPNPQPAPANYTGTWVVLQKAAGAECSVYTRKDETIGRETLKLTQTGSAIADSETGASQLKGTLAGRKVTLTNQQKQKLDVTLADDGKSFRGTGEFEVTVNGKSCIVKTTVDGFKQAIDPAKCIAIATGEWNIKFVKGTNDPDLDMQLTQQGCEIWGHDTTPGKKGGYVSLILRDRQTGNGAILGADKKMNAIVFIGSTDPDNVVVGELNIAVTFADGKNFTGTITSGSIKVGTAASVDYTGGTVTGKAS